MRPRLQGLMDRMSRWDRRGSRVETIFWSPSPSPLIGEDQLVRAGDELDALTAEFMCADGDALNDLAGMDDPDAGCVPPPHSLLLAREGFDPEAIREMIFASVEDLVSPLLEPLDVDEEIKEEIRASAATLLVCGLWLGRRVSRDEFFDGWCSDAE